MHLMMKLREDAPAKKNTIPLATKAKVSQKDSKEPDATSFGEMSNLLVDDPYSPNTATATTPATPRQEVMHTLSISCHNALYTLLTV